MYTIELNIGSLATPTIGGGWLEVNPDMGDGKLILSRGLTDILERVKMGGSFKFISDEYTAIKTLKDAGNLDIDFRVKYNAVVQFTGKMPLYGEWSTDEKVVSLEVEPNDLIGIITANLSKEYLFRVQDFGTAVKHDFTSSVRNRYRAVVFGTSPTYAAWVNYTSNGVYPVAAWSATTSYNGSQLLTTDMYWGWDGNDTIVTYGGQTFVSQIDNNLNNTPTLGGDTNWLRVEPAPERHTQEYADFEFTDAVWVEISTEITDAHQDEWQKGSTGTGSYTYVLFTIPLFTLLKAVLNQIDSSIDLFETTSGADTGFCQYLETNYPNKLKLYYKTWDSEPKITLQTIIDIYLKMFNCKWIIEDDTIFVFRHESERPTALGSDAIHDLTTFDSDDWTIYNYKDEPQKIKIERWKYSDSSEDDFQPVEIDYGTPYEEAKEYSLNIGIDIKHIVISEQGALIVAATGSAPNITLYNVTGIISGETAYNGSLAPVQCVSDHFQEGRLFSTYDSWTGGTTLTLTPQRLRQVDLKTRLHDLTGIVLRDYLFKTGLANVEVYEIKINFDGSMTELKAIW